VGFLVEAPLGFQHAQEMQRVELRRYRAYHALVEPLGVSRIARLVRGERLLEHLQQVRAGALHVPTSLGPGGERRTTPIPRFQTLCSSPTARGAFEELLQRRDTLLVAIDSMLALRDALSHGSPPANVPAQPRRDRNIVVKRVGDPVCDAHP